MDLKGKKVLVTGSTSGLGKGLVLEFARLGCNVIVHGRDKSKVEDILGLLKSVNPSGEYKGVICDLNKPELIKEAFSEMKNLDILINNAGVWLEGDTVEAKPEKIMELVNVNVASYLLVTRLLLPILQKSVFGQVLNVVSIAGVEIPFGYYHTFYTATKFGLQGFTEGLAKEFENKNIRIMGIYPGGMETQLFTKAGNDYKEHEPWMFNPQETIDAVVFMLTRNFKVNIKRLDIINHLQQ